MLDIDRLMTADLERALPLLLDMTDLIRGPAAATAIVGRGVAGVGADPRRRALVLALASDVIYGIPGGKRDAALDAISCAEAAGAPADRRAAPCAPQPVHGQGDRGRGLDTGLLDRAAGREASLPPGRWYDSADMHRGWSRFIEDLDTARAALRRPCPGQGIRDDDATGDLPCLPGDDRSAGRRLRGRGGRRGRRTRQPPGTTGRRRRLIEAALRAADRGRRPGRRGRPRRRPSSR